MIEIRNYIETQGYFYKSKAFEAENEFRVMISGQKSSHAEKRCSKIQWNT